MRYSLFFKSFCLIFSFFSVLMIGCTPKAEPISNDSNPIKALGYLCVYYGYPSLINQAKGDLNIATAEFSKFDLIVLGDGLQKNTHPDHGNTKTIIANLIAQKRIVLGYVDLGISTNNHSEASLRWQIDDWKSLGAAGIFFDNAGYDYKVTRSRQNVVIQHCRQQNLQLCMNAWVPDDVLADNSLMTKGDYYLAESFLVGNNQYFDLTAWKKKADACAFYAQQKGIKILCLATGGDNIAADFNNFAQFSMAWVGTAMYKFDYFQMTNILYSANNNTAYFFPNISTSYGTIFKDATPQKDSETHYFRSTDTHTLHIYGNGGIQGYGIITKP